MLSKKGCAGKAVSVARAITAAACSLFLIAADRLPDRTSCRVDDYLYEVDTSGIPVAEGGSGGASSSASQSADTKSIAKLSAHLGTVSKSLAANNATESDFLVLSGGGPWGAYGASFLRNWEATGTMPSFRVVTGVSTGALQATYAFLGDRDSLEQMEQLYGEITNDDVYSSRRLSVALLLRSGLNKLEPLRRLLIDEIRQNDWINRVASERERGRSLLVGVTELNSGKLYAVDMTQIASDNSIGNRRKRRCFADMLVASASVPVYFDPVVARTEDRENLVLVDGGVRAGSFITGIADAMSDQMVRPETGMVVINGPLNQCQIDTSGGIPDIAGRSISVLINQNVNNSLFRILQGNATGDSNVEFTAVSRAFALDQMGVDLCDFPSSTTDFDPAFTGVLIEQAARRWQQSRACAFEEGEACN